MKNEILEIAKEAAYEAGEKALSLFGKVSIVKEKESPTDIYSEADLAAEEVIYSHLSQLLLKFNYLSEEREFIDRDSEYTWVIDPLDGSTAFVAGLEDWSVVIGLLKDNKPIVGVVNVPTKQWLVWAGEGEGAFKNGERIRVSRQKEYDKAVVGFDVGHRGHRREDLLRNVAPQIDKVRYMPSYASSAFAQVLVAKGALDAYLHHRAYPWDFCAGFVIVKEAGGKVTDHQGKPIDWTKKDNLFLLASNGVLHNQILGEINK